MTTVAEVAAFIEFRLSGLRHANAHHSFEDLCRQVARLRLVSNVLPATGPVAGGGDQGRDFETFSTEATGNENESSRFYALAAKEPTAFACTVQESGLKQKIKDDVTAICSQGMPVRRVYFFCTQAFKVSDRHDARQWAADKFEVDLQILDRLAIAELLADPELAWIGQRYLDVPITMIADNNYRAPAGIWVRDDDPVAFGVHPSWQPPGSAGEMWLPWYVKRPHDVQLACALKPLEQGVSTAVFLVGSSAAGKTRACWEALRSAGRFDDWRIVKLDGIVDASQAVAHAAPKTVIWLDDLHNVLAFTEAGGRLALALNEALADPSRAPLLVLGTTWPSVWKRLDHIPAEGRLEEGAVPAAAGQIRRLLNGRSVVVAENFDASAREQLRARAAEDPCLAETMQKATDGRITQFLAGAPEVIKRYRYGSVAERALVHAAMDARRLGVGPNLPLRLLMAAAPGYLSDDQWNGLGYGYDALQVALQDLTTPTVGEMRVLTPQRSHESDRQDTEWLRLADPIEELGELERDRRAVPRQLWRAIAETVTDADALAQVANKAFWRHLRKTSCELLLASYAAGSSQALMELVAEDLFFRGGVGPDFLAWLLPRADAGDIAAANAMGYLFDHQSSGLAERYYRVGAEAGEAWALGQLGTVLERTGRLVEARAAYQAAIAAGHVESHASLAGIMELQADDEALAQYLSAHTALAGSNLWHDSKLLESAMQLAVRTGSEHAILQWLQTRALAGDSAAMSVLVKQWLATGREAEAVAWLTGQVESESDQAWNELHRIIGGGEKLRQWVRARLKTGGATHVWQDILDSLVWENADDDALARLIEQADGGDVWALRELAGWYESEGHTEQAYEYFQRCLAANCSDALIGVVRLLRSQGRDSEAETLIEEHLLSRPRGDAVWIRAYDLAKAGNLKAAIEHWEQLAAAGAGDALTTAALALSEAGRVDEALRFFCRAAESGCQEAMEEASTMLTEAGRLTEANDLAQYGIEPGGEASPPWSPGEVATRMQIPLVERV